MDVAIFTLRHNECEEAQADARTSSRREHGLKRKHRKLELLPLRRVRTLKSRLNRLWKEMNAKTGNPALTPKEKRIQACMDAIAKTDRVVTITTGTDLRTVGLASKTTTSKTRADAVAGKAPAQSKRAKRARAKTAEARVAADASAALVDSLQGKVNAWSADAAARRQLREDAVIDARTWRREDKEERKTAAKAAEKWRTDVLGAMDAQGDRMMKSLVQLLQPPPATTRAADVPGAAHGTHK